MSLIAECDAIRAIVEPTPEVGLTIDDSCAEPLVILARTVYVFDTDQSLSSIETGPPSQVNWTILALYVHDLTDEEPMHERLREVTLALSDRRDRWITRLLEADGEQVPGTLMRVQAEYDYIRTLGVRGIGVRVEGARVL